MPYLPRSICIATPAYGDEVKTGYVDSLLRSCLALQQRRVEMHFVTTSSSLIAQARNLAVDYFLKRTNATHLLFIDADMRWRVEDLMRMLGHGERDVLSAVAPRKIYDWHRIAEVARAQPDLDPALLPVHGVQQILPDLAVADEVMVGDHALTGLILIRREVFEDLARAHPDWLITPPNPLAGLTTFFSGGRTAHAFRGEDLAFGDDIRALGKVIHLCPWFRMGHIGTHEYVGDPLVTHRRG
ncbi:hypothetical protein [Methylobacterium aerolatum]|uniref:Glycosyltransferase n=1 Tax=Methylobacterium aerolatum TaxID=418708 RepID=A0ABU0HZE1_9HYPH|nr:hypothetical protein [Methylobacterium aerolatum]MDQ0447708.1 hypothetical protein [Methylobacterium aerolatum]GJD34808.1 hypothetical protein FMGBMHLM_1711 [Methylobacterium aerolatum]